MAPHLQIRSESYKKRRGEMLKQGVVPDELSKPFWDAANEGRLVIQNRKDCDRLQKSAGAYVSSI